MNETHIKQTSLADEHTIQSQTIQTIQTIPMSRYKSPFEVVQSARIDDKDFIQPLVDPEEISRKYQIRKYFMVNSYIRRNLSCSKSMDCARLPDLEHERIKSNMHSDSAGVLCVNGRKPFTVRFSVDGKNYVPGVDD